MTDREKVIKALEHCEFHLSKACIDCAYSKYNSQCLEAIKADALVLLREQKPVMPKDLNGTSVFRSACGNCGMPLYAHDFRFCPYCGRGVKWDD